MQLPAGSFDTNFHIFFASHYAQHWFNPWNEKWFAGFSQTTYPPLTHQWIAVFSKLIGLNMAYMLVQLLAIMLLPVGVYRFAKIWVDERSASYAALGSVFLGALSFLVYQAGQTRYRDFCCAFPQCTALLLRVVNPFGFPVAGQGDRRRLAGRSCTSRDVIFGLVYSLVRSCGWHVSMLGKVVPAARLPQ